MKGERGLNGLDGREGTNGEPGKKLNFFPYTETGSYFSTFMFLRT